MAALTITIYDDDSESDVDVDEINGVDKVGCTFEMKCKSTNDAAINECLYNMFGQSTRLVTWALEMGKLVEKANMYGLVAAMGNPDNAVLLKVSMDFQDKTCKFYMCSTKFKFKEILEVVLHRLQH